MGSDPVHGAILPVIQAGGNAGTAVGAFIDSGEQMCDLSHPSSMATATDQERSQVGSRRRGLRWLHLPAPGFSGVFGVRSYMVLSKRVLGAKAPSVKAGPGAPGEEEL